jgi:hypothetical protein
MKVSIFRGLVGYKSESQPVFLRCFSDMDNDFHGWAACYDHLPENKKKSNCFIAVGHGEAGSGNDYSETDF